jgi:hypothetical protein
MFWIQTTTELCGGLSKKLSVKWTPAQYVFAYGSPAIALGKWEAPGWHEVIILTPTKDGGPDFPWTGPVNEKYLHEVDFVYSAEFFNLWG